MGQAFYEVKRVNRNILYKNYKNIGAQIDVIANEFDDYVLNQAAFYYLATTANVTDVSSVSSYAKRNGITFGHYVSYYRIVNGQYYVKFKSRLNIFGFNFDMDVIGGNQNGVLVP